MNEETFLELFEDSAAVSFDEFVSDLEDLYEVLESFRDNSANQLSSTQYRTLNEALTDFNSVLYGLDELP